MKVLVRLLGLVLLAGWAGSAQAQVSARKILPNDILAIRVVGEPELTLDKRVGADGKITYPFILELSVEGKTVAEVEKEIRDLLDKDFIVQPQVTVEYRDYVKQWVTVVGQVNK
ncbi:MAG: polysaccharide biosynthesis/export family protein, partial [Verrucomicrobiota bacterium]